MNIQTFNSTYIFSATLLEVKEKLWEQIATLITILNCVIPLIKNVRYTFEDNKQDIRIAFSKVDGKKRIGKKIKRNLHSFSRSSSQNPRRRQTQFHGKTELFFHFLYLKFLKQRWYPKLKFILFCLNLLIIHLNYLNIPRISIQHKFTLLSARNRLIGTKGWICITRIYIKW